MLVQLGVLSFILLLLREKIMVGFLEGSLAKGPKWHITSWFSKIVRHIGHKEENTEFEVKEIKEENQTVMGKLWKFF